MNRSVVLFNNNKHPRYLTILASYVVDNTNQSLAVKRYNYLIERITASLVK